MPSSTHECGFATVVEIMAQSRSLLAERRSLLAKLDAMLVGIASSWIAAGSGIPDRAVSATLDAQKVEDEDLANARLAARIIEILSTAEIAYELRYFGVPLQ